jgi:cell division protease FtsH
MGTGITSLRVRDSPASEKTRRVRDEEVRELADEAFRTARSLIDSHRPQLDELASTLLANEVLERGDLDRIMAEVPGVRKALTGRGQPQIAATAVRPAAPPEKRW